MIDGEEREYTDPVDIPEDTLFRSRTFFHATLSDNPILEATGYGATIDALPEPLRSLLRGNFHAARILDPWQVIPGAWVRAAQARWNDAPPDMPLSVVGLDVARGGQDKTVLARMYGSWVAPLDKYPGVATPDGPTVATLAMPYAGATHGVMVDVIGVGASVYDVLLSANVQTRGINFAASAGHQSDRSGKLRYRNIRAAAYWKLREALDPDHGDNLALPPDPELLADLCAAKWKLTASGIQIEDKEEIRTRLGRSPDCADALALAYYAYAAPSGADLVGF